MGLEGKRDKPETDLGKICSVLSKLQGGGTRGGAPDGGFVPMPQKPPSERPPAPAGGGGRTRRPLTAGAGSGSSSGGQKPSRPGAFESDRTPASPGSRGGGSDSFVSSTSSKDPHDILADMEAALRSCGVQYEIKGTCYLRCTKVFYEFLRPSSSAHAMPVCCFESSPVTILLEWPIQFHSFPIVIVKGIFKLRLGRCQTRDASKPYGRIGHKALCSEECPHKWGPTLV